MENFNFDSGIVELAINGDESRVIRFNPTDSNFVDSLICTFNDSKKDVKDLEFAKENAEPEEIILKIKKVSDKICEKINNAFNAQVSDAIFGNISPLAVAKGKPVFVNFLEGITKFCENKINEESKIMKKTAAKYLNKYK